MSSSSEVLELPNLACGREGGVVKISAATQWCIACTMCITCGTYTNWDSDVPSLLKVLDLILPVVFDDLRLAVEIPVSD